MGSIDSPLPWNLLRSVNQSRDKGASSWLTAVPLVDHGLVLTEQEFRDSLRLKYNMPLSRLTKQECLWWEVCRLPCPITQKGKVRGAEARWCTMVVGKVCTNVEVEPQLQPLDNERFNLRSAVTSPEARLDLKAGGLLVSRSYNNNNDNNNKHSQMNEKIRKEYYRRFRMAL